AFIPPSANFGRSKNKPAASSVSTPTHFPTGAVIMDTTNPDNPGTSRRGVLKCMAWAGTGMVWTVAGGIPRGLGLGEAFAASAADGFTFVQISDSHIGFNKEANPDTNGTFQAAL